MTRLDAEIASGNNTTSCLAPRHQPRISGSRWSAAAGLTTSLASQALVLVRELPLALAQVAAALEATARRHVEAATDGL
jgi:hypothetical protein